MSRNAERTRADLLRAARDEFAEHGLAGARVDRIAQAAGVNKERIYGHFGSKDSLFDAVLAQAIEEAAAEKPLQPGDTPATYGGRSFDFHRTRPHLLRLLLWEALSRPVDTALDDPERRAHYASKVEALGAVGLDGDDARFALLVVLALASYSALLPQVTALVLGPGFPPEQLRARLVDAIDRLLPTQGAS